MKIFSFLLAACAYAAPVTCNTGFTAACATDGNTNPAALTTDGSWRMSLDPNGWTIGGPAYVMTNDWPASSAYLPRDSVSGWITPAASMDAWQPIGLFYFATEFDLTGYDVATAAISGRWLSDNSGFGIWLNGSPVAGAYPGYEDFAGAWAAFGQSGGFVSGVNTLVFGVYNGPIGTGGSPVALRVEYEVEAAHAPEPHVFLLVGVGLFLIGMRRRR